jgi:hypothetical protein
MPDDLILPEFNWVQARAECSLPQVFKQLQIGVQSDVEQLKRTLPANSNVRLSVEVRAGRFSVVRTENGSIPDTVDFALVRDAITVTNDDGETLASATLTLDDSGRCRLRVGSAELEQWQFRRKMLEELFFGPRRI